MNRAAKNHIFVIFNVRHYVFSKQSTCLLQCMRHKIVQSALTYGRVIMYFIIASVKTSSASVHTYFMPKREPGPA